MNGTLVKAQWSDALEVVGMSSAEEAFHHPSYFTIYDLLKGLSPFACTPRFVRDLVPAR